MCKFDVYLLSYDKDGYTVKEKLLVAKFVAEGDANAYAIHRAHNVPAGRIEVFEVYKGKKRLYRAG